jgi:hypothetical protein
MISLSVFRQRTVVKPILRLLCFLVVALAATIPARTENALDTTVPNLGMSKGYCASTLDQPIVYFSNIFDAATKARNKISTLPLDSAYKNYLVEEYDFKSSSYNPTGCSLFETLSQAEASKRQLVAKAHQGGKQIVEVNWNPGPLSEVSYGDTVAVGPAGPPPTHTFCAVGNQSTMYFSAVFDTQGSLPNPKWNDAFSEFLSKKYGFRAEVEATCTIMGTVREAEFNLKARIGGVRYNKHKAVETGWNFDPSGNYKPAPKSTPKPDDDPEPPPPPPVAPKVPPSQSLNEFAAKEGPIVLAYCQKDPMLSKIFDCSRVQRSVYNYRMQHGSSEPLASLFTQEKVNLAGAIDTGLNLWVKQRAAAQGFSNKVSGCIEQKFAVSFYDKPYISQMQKIYDASVAACK